MSFVRETGTVPSCKTDAYRHIVVHAYLPIIYALSSSQNMSYIYGTFIHLHFSNDPNGNMNIRISAFKCIYSV